MFKYLKYFKRNFSKCSVSNREVVQIQHRDPANISDHIKSTFLNRGPIYFWNSHKIELVPVAIAKRDQLRYLPYYRRQDWTDRVQNKQSVCISSPFWWRRKGSTIAEIRISPVGQLSAVTVICIKIVYRQQSETAYIILKDTY